MELLIPLAVWNRILQCAPQGLWVVSPDASSNLPAWLIMFVKFYFKTEADAKKAAAIVNEHQQQLIAKLPQRKFKQPWKVKSPHWAQGQKVYVDIARTQVKEIIVRVPMLETGGTTCCTSTHFTAHVSGFAAHLAMRP